MSDEVAVQGDAPGAPAAHASACPRRTRARAESQLAHQNQLDAVEKRLKWTAPAGLSVHDLARRLGWGGTVGIADLLVELRDGAKAHEREGVWYHGASDGSTPKTVVTPPQVDLRAKVIAYVAASPGRWWTRMQLAGEALSTTPLADAMRLLASMSAAGEIAEERGGVRSPRKSTAATGSPVAPETSVGPQRPVGGDTSSPLDSGTAAERDLSVAALDPEPLAGPSVEPEPSSSGQETSPARPPASWEGPDGTFAGVVPAAEDRVDDPVATDAPSVPSAAETASPPAAGNGDQEVSGCAPGAGAAEPDREPAAQPDRALDAEVTDGLTGPGGGDLGQPATPSGPELRAWRLALGVSQDRVAAALAVRGAGKPATLQAVLSGYERGQRGLTEALAPLVAEAYAGRLPIRAAVAEVATAPTPRREPGEARDLVLRLVAENPGITTTELNERVGYAGPAGVGNLCRKLGLRRELEPHPRPGRIGGTTVARWYPAAPAPELAEPSPPAAGGEGSIPEEPAPLPVAEPARPTIPSAGPDHEDRGRTASAVATGDADAPSDPPTGSPPPEPPRGAFAPEGGDLRAPVEINASLFDRVVNQAARIRELERQVDELVTRAEQAEAAERAQPVDLVLRVRQLEALQLVVERALDEGVELGIPERDWPLEARLGGLVTLIRRAVRARRTT